jgi:signal peptidase
LKVIEQLNRCSASFDRISVDLLQAGYALRFTAQGTSMSPLIRDGDVVLIEPICSKLPKPSEIVLFTNQQGNLVLHRVLKRWKKDDEVLYLLKGDQVATPDGIYEKAKIFGRLKAVERSGSILSLEKPVFKVLKWLAFLRSNTGLGSKGKLPALMMRNTIFSKYLD